MEPVFVVMAILGCGDGTTQCQSARIEPAHYSTMAQCRADAANALARNTDLEFPVISAQCRQSGMIVAERGKLPTRG